MPDCVLIGQIGTDVSSGQQRFTLDLSLLADGISLVSIALGCFGIAEIAKALGAAIANLTLLARPDDQPARPRRTHPPIELIDRMARISRGRFEPSYYATIF